MELKYIYTNHLLERLEERFGLDVDWANKNETYKKIDEIMAETNEDRSYLNNTKFMLNLHDLHGFDAKYEFRSHLGLNILFVMIHERGRKVVKTCYPLDSTKFIKRKNFQKKTKAQKRVTPRSKKRRQPLKEVEALHEHLKMNGFSETTYDFPEFE